MRDEHVNENQRTNGIFPESMPVRERVRLTTGITVGVAAAVSFWCLWGLSSYYSETNKDMDKHDWDFPKVLACFLLYVGPGVGLGLASVLTGAVGSVFPGAPLGYCAEAISQRFFSPRGVSEPLLLTEGAAAKGYAAIDVSPTGVLVQPNDIEGGYGDVENPTYHTVARA